MKQVQVDKNSFARKLVDSCNTQNLVRCCRLPRNLNDADDSEIIAFAKSKDRLLLTYDRPIAYQNAELLSSGGPGILIIEYPDSDSQVRKMAVKTAMQMLKKFKEQFPDWHLANWSNSIIHLQPKAVWVNHAADGAVILDGIADRTKSQWQVLLQDMLATNAARI